MYLTRLLSMNAFPLEEKLLVKVSTRLLFSLILAFSLSHSQIALEPEQGGIDFTLQGEYITKIGTANPLAAQVVARGAGKFQVIFFKGGLPGKGWNGSPRTEVNCAITETGKPAPFSGNGYTGSIAVDGLSLAGTSPTAEPFQMEKTMRQSPTLNAEAPSGALILFDGKDLSRWIKNTASIDARNLLLPEGSGAITNQGFQSFTLHVEFRVPFMPSALGASRGNSGIYLQGRDEVQILDSFGINLDIAIPDSLEAKRHCGAFYEYFRPTLNMSFPPLSWQTFDIQFNAARYDAAGITKLAPASASVWFNGVLVHDNLTLEYSTLAGDPQGPSAGPIRLQAHGAPVYFRNIWLMEGSTALKRPEKKFGGNWHALSEKFRYWTRLDGRHVQDGDKTSLRIGRN